MTALNNAVRHATDGFIGILDMFGFEDPKPSQLEHLCINLCAETMQHFYNTHIFKSSIESCRDEGIRCDVEVDYVDNVPCIDLISSLVIDRLERPSFPLSKFRLETERFAISRSVSQRTGLLSMLDVECSIRGTAESYVAKVKVQHKQNPRLFEPRTVDCRSFGIQHFAGRVTYDASDFLGKKEKIFFLDRKRIENLPSLLESKIHVRERCVAEGIEKNIYRTPICINVCPNECVQDSIKFSSLSGKDTNKDVVPDDLVAVFYKHTCSFGFATHLFGSELKALYASDTVPRGVSFRISPTSHTDL